METVTLKGSCLCGAVTYSASGRESRFYHCHCSRCRKVSGTGHCSNLFLSQGALEWLNGEDLLNDYMPPDASRFKNRFCRTCGSRMPRFDAGYDMVFIPAGSLDDTPGMRPQARIFFGSRADWSCDGDDIPKHEEYRTDR